MTSSYPESLEISDVIGSGGRYQVLATISAFYLMSISGCLGVFVQFLAPEVILSWQSDDEPNVKNIKEFRSTTCKMDDIFSVNQSLQNVTLQYYSRYSQSTLTEKILDKELNEYVDLEANEAAEIKDYSELHCIIRVDKPNLGLICESSWLVSLANSVMMLGAVIGTVILGRISEKYGRRKQILFLLIPIIAANGCILFVQDYVTFLVACFVYGAFTFSINNAGFISAVEVNSIRLRPMLGPFAMCGVILGQAVIAVTAFFFRDWWYIQLGHLIFISSALLFNWYILESPCWLVIRQREDEARNVLRKIVSRNGLDLAVAEPKISVWIQTIKRRAEMQSSTQEGTFCDLFRTATIRKYTISVAFVLFTSFFVFFGCSMNVDSFGSNLFQDLLICSGLSVLSMFFTILGLFRFSLRQTCFASFFLVTLICLLYPFTYEFASGKSVLSGLLRFTVTSPFTTSISYAAEVLPTSVRSVGFGFVTMIARVGATLCPFTRELGVSTTVYIPILLFAVLSLISTILFLFVLPDTRGQTLTQTIQDLQKSERKKTFLTYFRSGIPEEYELKSTEKNINTAVIVQ